MVSDLKVKYANSVLGFAWSLLNPLLMLIVLYFVFSNVFKGEDHFVVYILIGLLAWRFFSIGTNAALNSIVGKPSLVTKIFIPRQILTLSSVLSGLISSTLEFIVLIPLLVIFGDGLKWTIILFPVVQLLFFLIIYGLSLMLASMYVYFRDLNQIWDVLLQLGMFLSPIVYPISVIPEQYRPIYLLNPITCVISMYRDIFLYGYIPQISDLLIVVVSIAVLLSAGTLTFNKLSRRFAEEV
ncbi:MAG TPA: ABC transporter permease [Methanocella sp.]|nr:ABC transporter permease [Methanocella sp.]